MQECGLTIPKLLDDLSNKKDQMIQVKIGYEIGSSPGFKHSLEMAYDPVN